MENTNYDNIFIGNIYVLSNDEFIPAGTFALEEVTGKNCFIVGYKEAITGEMVVNRLKRKYVLRHGLTEYDVDSVKPFKNLPGDIVWKVSRYPITCILSPSEVANYLRTNPESVRTTINYVRNNTDEIIKTNEEYKLRLKQ